MHFGFSLDSSDINLWDIDLLDIDLDFWDTLGCLIEGGDAC